MKIASTPKQFKLSHILIDDRLQGASLASFTKRLMAYSLDLMIVWACTHLFWLIIPLGLLLLFYKKKFKITAAKSRRMIRLNVLRLERKFDNLPDVDQQLKARVRRGMKFYLYILLYLPAVLLLLLIARVIFELYFPQQYLSFATSLNSFFEVVFKPFLALGNTIGLLSKFLGAFIYFSVFTWKWNGQTPGKRLLKIRVVKLNGTPITFWNSLERASGYAASASIVFLGFFQYFWDRNAQTTHDKITETIVIDADSLSDELPVQHENTDNVVQNKIVVADTMQGKVTTSDSM